MSTPASQPRDPGLQPERTALAWRRTILAFLGSTLLLARLTAERSLALTVVLVGLALPMAAVAGAVSWRRYRRYNPDRHLLPDGTLPAVVTALAAVLGLTGIVYVLLR